MQKLLFTLVLALFAPALYAQKVCVGLFFDVPVKELSFVSLHSEYTLWVQDTQLVAIRGKGETLKISTVGNLLHIEGVGNYREVSAIAGSVDGSFGLRPLQPLLWQRTYAQNVVFKAVKGNIVIINKLDEDYYLAGVCESEAGCNATATYYKVQSIMSRTYLYAHFDRHAKDGFNMCDGVHCQAYKGLQTRCAIIKKSIAQTDGILVIDKDKKPIAPTFSANCGGQTSNSEDVWKNKLPYLRSTKDTYCRHSHGANWTKKIPLAQWKAFMNQNGLYSNSNKDFNFSQSIRKKYYTVGKNKIELTRIRQQFGLRSAFFSVQVYGNEVLLTGRGYGHGVGVCQEGAMRMAAAGISYQKILQHYYRRTDVLEFAESQPHAYMLYNYGDIFNPWIGRMPLTVQDGGIYDDDEDFGE
jgi:stage II sporulation protein D